jgi:hypothetical protein
MDISTLMPGLYMVRISDGKGVETLRVVKE